MELENVLRSLPARDALLAERSRRRSTSLAGFVKEAWEVLEPADPLSWGWALDAMCEHLEAVTAGDIRRLLINVPPGMMKSVQHSTPVRTADGWVQHGDLQPGHQVYGPDGQLHKVLAVTPSVVEECAKVIFNDNSQIVCGLAHEWRLVSGAVVETHELLAYNRVQAVAETDIFPAIGERYVKEVRRDSRQITKCIQVEGGMYLVGYGMIPTHNSLLVNVFWPAWEWGPCALPHLRHIGATHNHNLALRDNRKARNLIFSEWYRACWPEVELTADQNAKIKFENTRTGFREIMAFTSMTGNRGHRVAIDDPHSVDTAESDAEREKVLFNFRESLPSRIINDSSAIVIIMQRLHEDDISGEILREGLPYEHLCLPMEFEPESRCRTRIGFSDPRTAHDELLFPERFSAKTVDELKKAIGEFATAGQLQQRPAPRGGGAFKEDDWQYIDFAPDLVHEVRGWDLAATKAKSRAAQARTARTAGVKMGMDRSGRIIITHVAKGHWSPSEVETKLESIAKVDGLSVVQDFPQDPGQAGKAQRAALARRLGGLRFYSSTEQGSKEGRAYFLQSQQEAGNVFLVKGAWNKAFVKEAAMFPVGSQADQVDAASRAYARLLMLSQTAASPGMSAPIVIEA